MFVVPVRLLAGRTDIATLKRDLTAKYFNPVDGTTTNVKLYKETDNYFSMPRVYGKEKYPDLWENALDRTTKPKVKRGAYPKLIEPRNQEQQAFFAAISTRIAEALDFKTVTDIQINAMTGTGKTVAAMASTSAYNIAPILIIVHRNRVKAQWRGNVEQGKGYKFFFGERWTDRNVGSVQQDEFDVVGRNVVIAMGPTLVARKFPPWFYEHFSVIVIDECFTDETELLTPNGWISVAKIDTDTLVAQYDTDHQSISYVNPLRTIKRKSSGNLVRIEGKKFDLLTTLNHEQPVIYRSKGGELYETRYTVDKLPLDGKAYIPVSGFALGTGTFSALERLKVAYQADGHNLYTAGDGTYTYRFAFLKKRKIEALIDILGELGIGFKYIINARGDTVITIRSTLFLDKYFSWVGFQRSSCWYHSFLEELTKWDGWTDQYGNYYETPIEINANIVQTASHLSGHVATITNPKEDRFRVRWTDRLHVSVKGRKEHIVYNGHVYCVTVPTGNLLVRHNGKIFVSGNCHKFAAPMLSQILGLFSASVRIAMTATEKQGAMGKVVSYHLGTPAIISTQEAMRPTVVNVINRMDVQWGDRFDNANGLKMMLSRSKLRNELLTQLVFQRGYNNGRRCLVIGDRVGQLQTIQKNLIKLGVPQSDIGLYVGKYKTNKWKASARLCEPSSGGTIKRLTRSPVFDKKEDAEAFSKAWSEREDIKGAWTELLSLGLFPYYELEAKHEEVQPSAAEYDHIENHSKIVLATYGIFDVAIDISTLDWGIEATPRSDVEQAVGRILRIAEGKKTPAWYNIEDVITTFAEIEIMGGRTAIQRYIYGTPKRLAEKRRSSYVRQNASFKTVKNPYASLGIT